VQRSFRERVETPAVVVKKREKHLSFVFGIQKYGYYSQKDKNIKFGLDLIENRWIVVCSFCYAIA
jgi:hypothetical protein